MTSAETADVAIVGAGAAGLATAIFAARRLGPGRVVLLDTSPRPGAKILVSGGGRCNVTNRVVTERDFNGGPPHLVRRVLRAFPADDAVAFFREIGVALHEEEHGKLFPDSNRARTVLDALLEEAAHRGVALRTDFKVTALRPEEGAFAVVGDRATLRARRVALASGGLSLPKTGSDGGGYGLARSLGHSLVPTTPALVPLVLDGSFHAGLTGVAQEVELRLLEEGKKAGRFRGALLFTHFGISGPVTLDVSRHLLRACLAGGKPRLLADLLPGHEASSLLLEIAKSRPRAGLQYALEGRLKASVIDAVAAEQDLAPGSVLSQLPREKRLRLAAALQERELLVRASRGYGFAEVTAGGVPLAELDLRSMASRVCPGLLLVGEILDVDGRLGGFNFQWAWSSGFVAGQAIAGS